MALPTPAQLAENIVVAMEGLGVAFDATQRTASLNSMEGLAAAILDLFDATDPSDLADDVAELFGRVLTAGAGLTGGGDLSADRTFNVVAADSSIIVTADAVAAAVKSVHGRTGNVVAAAHDYDADQVDYDNAGSSLSATHVAAAIDELDSEKVPSTRSITAGNGLTGGGDLSADRTLNVVAGDSSIVVSADSIAAAVKSVHGRTGAVAAAASDYDADQVDYDNASSGLDATNVQDAIDEINRRGISFALGAAGWSTGSSSFATLGHFIWDPNWSLGSTLVAVRFAYELTKPGGSEVGGFQLYDATAGQAIATRTALAASAGVVTLDLDSTLANIPSALSLIQIQGLVSSGGTFTLRGLHLVFETI